MNYSSYGNFDRAGIGMLAGMGTGMIVVMVALIVFEFVCMWKIFEKAGEPGWKCLIPIYGAYVYFKIAWEGKYFWLMILAPVLASILMSLGIATNSSALMGIGSFLTIIMYVAIIVIAIIAMLKLAKRFGKSAGFAVGLILLSIVFTAILAFDSSDYDRSRA